jgi:hypothetical protein
MNAFMDVVSPVRCHQSSACEALSSGRNPCDLPLEFLRIREEGQPHALTCLVGEDLFMACVTPRTDRSVYPCD